MYYHSGLPKVVGEFDAAALQDRIDVVAPQDGSLLPSEVVALMRNGDGINPYYPIDDLADIRWSRLFRQKAFTSVLVNGQFSHLSRVVEHQPDLEIDQWHPDKDQENIYLTLPEIITTSSKWPTQFLIGNIALKPWQLPRLNADFWLTEEGKEAIEKAQTKGDAFPHCFKPGEVLHAPPGAIHRRLIPAGSTGYRYFMRRYPTINTLHSSTNSAQLRFFNALI